MPYYRELILEYLRKRKAEFREYENGLISFTIGARDSTGSETWSAYALIKGERGGIGSCIVACPDVMSFRADQMAGAMLACNKLNAAGVCCRWILDESRKLKVSAYADLMEETAIQQFGQLTRSLGTSLALGLPELSAAKRGEAGRSAAEYAAAFVRTVEDELPPERKDSLYADELEEYLRQTEYIGSREDESTMKIRLECAVFADVSFRGGGDTGISCRVWPAVREEQTARALIACNRLHAKYGSVFYMTGTGEIYMRRDVLLTQGKVGEHCALQFREMLAERGNARKQIQKILQ